MHPDDEVGLDAVEEKIASLLVHRRALGKELGMYNQRRRELRNEIRAIGESIRHERRGLSDCYLQLEASRGLRRKILAGKREVRERIDGAERVLKKMERSAPRASGEALMRRVQEAEWKLQTQRLTKEEEKQLVENIRKLEVDLHQWKEAYNARQELSHLISEAQSLRDEFSELEESRSKLEPVITAKRESVARLLEKREQLSHEMAELEGDALKLEEKLARTDAEVSSLREGRRRIMEKKKAGEEEARRARERQLFEQSRSRAVAKLSEGKKMTLEELKLIYGDEGEAFGRL